MHNQTPSTAIPIHPDSTIRKIGCMDFPRFSATLFIIYNITKRITDLKSMEETIF